MVKNIFEREVLSERESKFCAPHVFEDLVVQCNNKCQENTV